MAIPEDVPLFHAPPHEASPRLDAAKAGLRRAPAVLIAALIGVLDNAPYGYLLFPSELAQLAPTVGVAMVLTSAAVSQLAFAFSSRFDCALGCTIVENIPFFRAMADGVIAREAAAVAGGPSAAVGERAAPTVLALFALSTAATAAACAACARYRLGRFAAYIPRHVLLGCIGGMGAFIFFAGVGVGDCTGPMDGVGMMGYARLSQISTGLRQRQKARAFVVAETRPTFLRRRDAASLNSSKRDDAFDEDDDDEDDDDFDNHLQKKRTKNALVALVVVDACMVFPDLKPAVLRRVAQKIASTFGADEEDALRVFDEANVCVCATHTHSAPGGYAPHGLYNLTFGGAVSESFEALARGAADALFAAFADAFCETSETEPKRTVAFARGALVGASANRSRSAHARNPETDTAPFARAGGVNETIIALVVGAHDEPDELDETVGVGEKKTLSKKKKHSFPAASPRGTPCTARPFPARTR